MKKSVYSLVVIGFIIFVIYFVTDGGNEGGLVYHSNGSVTSGIVFCLAGLFMLISYFFEKSHVIFEGTLHFLAAFSYPSTKKVAIAYGLIFIAVGLILIYQYS